MAEGQKTIRWMYSKNIRVNVSATSLTLKYKCLLIGAKIAASRYTKSSSYKVRNTMKRMVVLGSKISSTTKTNQSRFEGGSTTMTCPSNVEKKPTIKGVPFSRGCAIEFYAIGKRCQNCGFRDNEYHIPKGRRSNEYTLICCYCECEVK